MIEQATYIKKRIDEVKIIYQSRNIPMSYFKDSLRDLEYRYQRYYKQHGQRGLSDWDLHWLEDVFQAKLIDIGVLRFQIFRMDHALIERSGDDYMSLNETIKSRFPEGMMMLNVHIVEGANLVPDLVNHSFKEAREFFTQYFPEYDFKYFICRTWLLDESLVPILKDESNILQFRQRFEILARNNHKSHPLKRIYGTDVSDDIMKLEKHSQLQKEAIHHINNLGVSFGCIPF